MDGDQVYEHGAAGERPFCYGEDADQNDGKYDGEFSDIVGKFNANMALDAEESMA